MKLRRAGQREAAPPVARPPIDVSERRVRAPGRIAGIRGLDALAAAAAEAERQTEAFWRAVWSEP